MPWRDAAPLMEHKWKGCGAQRMVRRGEKQLAREVCKVSVRYTYLYESSFKILPTHLTLILHYADVQQVKYVAFVRRTCHLCSIFSGPQTGVPPVDEVCTYVLYCRQTAQACGGCLSTTAHPCEDGLPVYPMLPASNAWRGVSLPQKVVPLPAEP